MQAFLSKFNHSSSIENKYLYKITGTEQATRRNAWWILRVEPQKLAVFTNLIKNGNLTLGEYGKVEDCGYGDEIPDSVLKKFGFNQLSGSAA